MHIECRICKNNYVVDVDMEKYTSWKDGSGYIQDIMPELSADDRELLISNTCGNCWIEIFGTDDEDEDYGEELY